MFSKWYLTYGLCYVDHFGFYRRCKMNKSWGRASSKQNLKKPAKWLIFLSTWEIPIKISCCQIARSFSESESASEAFLNMPRSESEILIDAVVSCPCPSITDCVRLVQHPHILKGHVEIRFNNLVVRISFLSKRSTWIFDVYKIRNSNMPSAHSRLLGTFSRMITFLV